MPTPSKEMKPIHYKVISTQPSSDSGIYTWVIASDTVYSDGLVAEAFGFSPAEARKGMPLQSYLTRMHPEDLPRVAKAIHDTMLSGHPFSEPYRICRPDGSIVEIMAFGSCFRDGTNEPSHYSGIVFPTSMPQSQDNAIVSHLVAAHRLACAEGQVALADRIVDALVEIGWGDTEIAPHLDHIH